MRTPHVLVIDDEAHITAVIAHRLRADGLVVVEAYDAETALRAARHTRFDVIVCDLHLPGVPGLELCQRLAVEPVTARTPVLIISGAAHELNRYDLATSNIVGVLAKPFSPRALGERCAEIARQATRGAIDESIDSALDQAA